MTGDLHVHTRFSDGSCTVDDVLLEASRRGLSYVSITDQDTTAGLPYAMARAVRPGITVLPGVEITAFAPDDHRFISILGYSFSLPASHIEALCSPIRDERTAATHAHIESLNEAGYPVSIEHAQALALEDLSPEEREVWPGVLYPVHLMMLLTRNGTISRPSWEHYRSLLRTGDSSPNGVTGASAADAVAAIHADGGRAVLACPGCTEAYDLVSDLVDVGLDGIELYHPQHGPDDHRTVLKLADRFGLTVTGGSDFRGDWEPSGDHAGLGDHSNNSRFHRNWYVGHGLGDIRAPHGAFERLHSYGHEDVDWAIALIRSAGDRIRSSLFEDRSPDFKRDHRDLVTQVDKDIEQFLTEAIHARFPNHQILGEESENLPDCTDSPMWIIDPVDGTTNFVSAGFYYGISVAFFERGRPVFGIVYDCAGDSVYVGIAGGGAYRDGMPLKAPPAKPLKQSVLEISDRTVRRLRTEEGSSDDPGETIKRFRAQRSLGCSSLGICRVAAGTLDVYFTASIAIWDYAAAAIVLLEAGGALAVENRASEQNLPDDASQWFHRDKGYVLAVPAEKMLDEVQNAFLPHRRRPLVIQPSFSLSATETRQ